MNRTDWTLLDVVLDHPATDFVLAVVIGGALAGVLVSWWSS